MGGMGSSVHDNKDDDNSGGVLDNKNGGRGASEDDESPPSLQSSLDSDSEREQAALQLAYDANRFFYTHGKGWPKNEVPAMELAEFHELRRNHVRLQVKLEEDRHEVTGPTHLSRTLDQLNDREERERERFANPVQECLENQYKRSQGLYESGGKHAYDEATREWYAARQQDVMRYEGAACLTAGEADLRALKPGDKLGYQLITFIRQLPEDRRRMIYIADTFQGPPMFNSPRILKSADHTLDRSTEMWVNFNDRAWMMTAELKGLRPTELYEPSARGTTFPIEIHFEPESKTLTMHTRSSWSIMDLRIQIEQQKGVSHHEQEMIVEWCDQEETSQKVAAAVSEAPQKVRIRTLGAVAKLADLCPAPDLRTVNEDQTPNEDDDFWAAAEAAERKETKFRGGRATEVPEVTPAEAADTSSLVANQAAH
jgi:hypothetical protein